MPDFALKALEYGVLGFSALMLLAAWRILVREQGREGEPRQGIMSFTRTFMGFCFALVILNTGVEVWGSGPRADDSLRIAELEESLGHAQSQLRAIESATAPLLRLRSNLVGSLPDSLPQKLILVDMVRELQQVLGQR